MLWICDLWGLCVGLVVVMWVWWVCDLLFGGGGSNLLGLWPLWVAVMIVLGSVDCNLRGL